MAATSQAACRGTRVPRGTTGKRRRVGASHPSTVSPDARLAVAEAGSEDLVIGNYDDGGGGLADGNEVGLCDPEVADQPVGMKVASGGDKRPDHLDHRPGGSPSAGDTASAVGDDDYEAVLDVQDLRDVLGLATGGGVGPSTDRANGHRGIRHPHPAASSGT